MNELLTIDQMYEADRRAIKSGIAGVELMQNAGRAIADEIIDNYSMTKVAVLCGPGNNGGDGFVVARLLKQQGWPVTLSLLGDPSTLKGDAALMAKRWDGPVEPLDRNSGKHADLIVDAIFGAGLGRDIEGELAKLILAVNEARVPVIAVDVPSGVDGLIGIVRGVAFKAQQTVTFCRKKSGHLLMPGRGLCGKVFVADIGISDEIVTGLDVTQFENTPELWHPHFPQPSIDSHKYLRGATVVVSGPARQTGAARLAARGALRVGSGVVTVASPSAAVMVNACQLTAIMVKGFKSAQALNALLRDDRRIRAVVIGPGAGIGNTTRNNVRSVLDSGVSAILDADALTSFEQQPVSLFEAITEQGDRSVVMTPHAGEFRRLFADIAVLSISKLEHARKAARTSGAVVVYKGVDTIIAEPGGMAAINANAPPTLATAGSGDVLAGMIAGLMAQEMSAFYAACAGVWLHGQAATLFGPGLIAEDIAEILPQVLQQIESV
jgi:ADP-dependent NAD(P)H-hydrate dehydratase / NAD(P)H-hydrate epimerase